MGTDVPLVYSHSPKPVGFPLAFRLSGNRLLIDSTRSVDEIALAAVAEVRLTYEPRSVARRAFKTTVKLEDGRSFALSSLSWRSLTRVDEQAAEYRAFVTALLRAISRASPRARFVAGKPAPIWCAAVVLAVAAFLGIALFVWRALAAGASEAALFGLIVLAGGLWQAWPFVGRNRPETFRPDAPPDRLMPAG